MYISTDLLGTEPVKSDFLSPAIELHSFRAHKRVCHTCCDPSDCVQEGTEALTLDEMLPPCPRRG